MEVAMVGRRSEPRNPGCREGHVFDNMDSYAYDHCQRRWRIVTLAVCSIQILQFVNLANLSVSYARWAPVKRGRFAHFLCSLFLLVIASRSSPCYTLTKCVLPLLTGDIFNPSCTTSWRFCLGQARHPSPRRSQLTASGKIVCIHLFA